MRIIKKSISCLFLLATVVSCSTSNKTTTRKDRVKSAQKITVSGNVPAKKITENPDKRVSKKVEKKK